MRRSRLLSAPLALVLALGLSTLGIASAQAATSVDVSASDCVLNTDPPGSLTYTLAPGEVLEFTNNSGGVCYFGAQSQNYAESVNTVGVVEVNNGSTWFVVGGTSSTSFTGVRYTAPTDGTTSDVFFLRAYKGGVSPQKGYNVTITINEPAASGNSGPTWQLQQLPLPASGDCADADPENALWAKTLTSPWTLQWGEWSEPVEFEGWVCGRWVYSDGTAAI